MENSKGPSPFSTVVGKDQSKDTGMALTLVCLLVAHFSGNRAFMILAMITLVVDMIWPNAFYYPARVWFGLAHVMGTVVSKILLTLLYCILVVPIGVLRRLGKADPMKTRQWKKNGASVFAGRDHKYEAKDIEQPY